MSTGACCSTRDELAGISSVGNACQFHAAPSLRANSGTRRKRQFTPDEQKDSNYWLKRTRNNEAAKRSRQRKRLEENLLETRAVELQRENDKLKAVLSTVHHSTAQNNPMHAAFGFPLGLPNEGYPRSLPVPTTVLPLRSLPHCPFSGCCGSLCPQTNHFSSVFDLVSYPVLKNAAATNTTKPPRINLLDSYHPMGRYSHGNTCTSGAYQRNRSFANGNDSAQTMHGLPDYRNTLVNLSRVPRCYNYNASSSEMAQSCARQPGPIGAAHEGEMQANAAELTCQQQTTTQSVLLPHKLRYKGGNARFASANFSS